MPNVRKLDFNDKTETYRISKSQNEKIKRSMLLVFFFADFTAAVNPGMGPYRTATLPENPKKGPNRTAGVRNKLLRYLK